jgi:hypothetical protein
MCLQDRGGRSPYKPNDGDFEESIDALFTAQYDACTPEGLTEIAAAFQNLTGIYLHIHCPVLFKVLHFDLTRIALFIQRFHRDAFGVQKFRAKLKSLENEKHLDDTGRKEILETLKQVSVRINSLSPRQSRIAAAFSLWLATFRPVYFHKPETVGVKPQQLVNCCAELNLWMACAYLDQFGQVSLTRDWADDERLDELRYDFTYRAISLSSLEFLYANILTKRH